MSSTHVAEPTFEAVRDYIKLSVRSMTDVLDPEEDWPPILFLNDGRSLDFEFLCGYAADTAAQKNYLANVVIPGLVHENRAKRAALAIHCWNVRNEDDPHLAHYAEAGLSLGDHPARRESVFVLMVDATRCEGWQADVRREPGRRPKLGPWQLVDDAASRFTAPLIHAVRGSRRA